MTSPDPGSSRPGRIAGVALLGVAAVAMVIGLITLFGGNGDGRADDGGDARPPASQTTTSSSRPSSESSTTDGPPASTTSTRPPTSSGSPTATTTTGQPPASGDGNGETVKTVPVRVLNNSTVRGLASDAADDLKSDGWNVTEVGNYSAGIIPTTTVYYRPGTDEEATARAIGAAFGMRVEERFEGIRDARPGVIVIVTNDYGSAPAGGDKNNG